MAKKRPALGHRERQIVEAVYRLGEASVSEVLNELPEPPSYSTVRAMLGSLVDKKVLRFRRDGKRYLYRPAVAAELARKSALENVLATFFAGRTSDAFAALLDVSGNELSDEELREIKQLVDERRRQIREGDSL
ncbi:BlaI/MecI/CopY family transcriptional regulator [Gimesia algae]|uniref:Transcriptional repressor CopY n=1 Tax=Gimesia algae TaxID=2527971 RepID=A0A517VGR1_9PLAN|nr:BlaI/MecI/CopY family transcriptional regulator [Gimesia algae]QDT92192.1 Transcriptional repressor CopY [Gimesia algae]